jgi:hypothetical protein
MRPRFQFRVRTLMIGVTLLAVACGYVGWQAKIVKNRRELLESSKPTEWSETDDEGLSWLRRKLGDRAYKRIYIAKSVSPEVIERFRERFSEAVIEQVDIMVGKWVCDYAGHKNGYSVVFYPDGEVVMGINVQGRPFEPAEGHYTYDPTSRAVTMRVSDTGDLNPKPRESLHTGRLIDDEALLLDEHVPGAMLRLTRGNLGDYAQ